MDFEKLIDAVKCRPQLWNKKEKNYTNRIMTDNVWDGVSYSLSASKDDCKKKWKYLKDEYRKALRKVQKSQSGGMLETYKSKFKYFQMMSFLKDHVSSHGEVRNVESFKIDESSRKSLTSEPSDMNFTDTLPCRKRQIDMDDAPLEMFVEQKKPKTSDDDCDDLLFFRSLLPYVKNLSSVKKLRMRGEMQYIVLKYFENEPDVGMPKDELILSL